MSDIDIDVDVDSSGATRGLSQVDRSLASTESRFRSAGRTAAKFAAGGLLVAGAAAVKFAADTVRSASDAQQSLGATESVFGRFASKVVAHSKRAADGVGLSANEYRESANLLGSLFKNQGVEADRLAGKTREMIRVGADLAATYGGTTAEAVEALSSAYKGEFDPLERYGIGLKQSGINAELAKRGQDKLTGAALKQAQQVATTKLVLDQAGTALGAFGREADTAAGQQQRLNAKFEDAKARIGTALLPVLTDLMGFLSREGIPVLEKFGGWLQDNEDQVTSTATAIGGGLLTALRTLFDVGSSVVRFIDDLPDGFVSIGLQAAAAALILPKLTLATQTLTTNLRFAGAAATAAAGQLTTAAGRAAAAQAAMTRLAGAAKFAAGVGGMLLLSEASRETSRSVGALEGAAGGALLGFSVGGPWGAAIGAGAGALFGLATAGEKAGDSFKDAIPPAGEFASSLDKITGKATAVTRELVALDLQERGLASAGQAYGLSTRDLVDAILGQDKAVRKVDASYKELGTRQQVLAFLADQAAAGVDVQETSLYQLMEAVYGTSDALKDQVRNTREVARAAVPLPKLFRELAVQGGRIPRKIVTKIDEQGLPSTMRGVRALARQYDLTPKQKLTVFKVSGIPPAKRDVDGLNKKMKDTGNTPPNIVPWRRGLGRALTDAQRDVDRGTGNINRQLRSGTAKARPDLGPFQSGIRSGLNSAQGTARSGGSSVGSALKAGVQAGFSGTASVLAAQAAAAVRTAVAAARAAGRIFSPSREMQEVGRQLGDGMVVGLRDRERAGATASGGLVTAILKAARNQATTSVITRYLKSKGVESKRIKSVIGDLRQETAALNRNAAARKNLQEQLKAALKARDQYAASIRAGIVETGDVTGLGIGDDGSVSATTLVNDLKSKLEQARRYDVLVRRLQRQGLNRTSMQDILDKGVEGGLATAEAIASGGQQTIREINRLTGQLGATGGPLGRAFADKFYGAGGQAAAGLIAGLRKRDRELKRTGEVIAGSFVRRLQRASGAQAARPQPRDVYTRRRDDNGGAVHMRLTAQQLTQLQRGREIRADLDAFDRAGGRRRR